MRSSITTGWRRSLQITAVTTLANAVPGAALFLYLQFGEPSAGGAPNPGHAHEVMVITFIVVLAVTVPFGFVASSLSFLPTARWLASGLPPTPAQQAATLRQPLLRAAGAFISWAFAAVVFGVVQASIGYGYRTIVFNVAGVLLAGLASSSLSALLVERFMRPIFVLALAGNPPEHRFGIAVLPRLLIAWAFGSGVPLVALLLAPWDQGDRTLHSVAWQLVLLGVAGLVSGFTIITGAARAVADPLRSIRVALRRVERGDLDVEVPVYDGGEVGQLQVGVNRMVAGLRQRRQLEDLFGRYVGHEVAEQAIGTGVDFRGERREATVLFVDLIGSTRLALELDAETVVRILNVYFGAVVGAVAAEGGWVNKFEGDGALCVFGPPGHDGGHAARALRAALQIQAELAGSTCEARLAAAVGVSSGTVVAGNIGARERFEYTVIGDPVNEAARLTERAKAEPSGVLASGRAIARAGTPAGWRLAQRTVLRGRTEPTELWTPSL